MSSPDKGVAELIKKHQMLFKKEQGVILDLACGKGQNGLYLHQKNVDIIFADINQDGLNLLTTNHGIEAINCWHADFESTNSQAALQLSNTNWVK